MSTRKNCSHCGGKLGGFNNYATNLNGITLCAKCYDKFKPFSKGKKYETIDSLMDDISHIDELLTEEGYSSQNRQEIEQYFDKVKNRIINGIDENENVDKYGAFLIEIENGKYDDEISAHMQTSGFNFEGYRIIEYFGVVSGEIVLGTGMLSGFTSGWADFLGVESNMYRQKLIESRNIATKRAIIESVYMGGNALIGIDIDYVVFQADKIGLIVNATSVKIEKII